MTIFIRFLSKEGEVKEQHYLLAGVVSLFISLKVLAFYFNLSKFLKLEDNRSLTMENLFFLSNYLYSKDQFFDMEIRIMKSLKWHLNYPLPGEISRFLLNQLVKDIEDVYYDHIDEIISYALSSIFFSFPD